jgi:lysophospholipase L1-like esterase
MVRRAVLVGGLALAAGLALGCAGSRAHGTRQLPADQTTQAVYVALGDSTVEGIGATSPLTTYVMRLHAHLRRIYPRATVANLGVSGATSADVVADQLEAAVARRPHLVTISIGPNDITTRVPVATYERNVATVFGRLARETDAVVVANLLPDLAVTPRFRATAHEDVVGEQTIRFNEALTRQARRFGVDLVDLYTASRAEVPDRPELLAADGYHPSDEGYARWAALVWRAIAARVPVPVVDE